MKIYIPTRGRAEKIITLNAISGRRQRDTYLVVRPEEEAWYREFNPLVEILVLPDEDCKLGEARDFIQHHAHANGFESYVAVDDDVVFQRRNKFWRAMPMFDLPYHDPKNYDEMWDKFENWLEVKKRHSVGLMLERTNMQNCQLEGDEFSVARQCCVHGYRTDSMQRLFNEGVRHTDMVTNADFYITLHMLTRGMKNYMILEFVYAQKSNNEGGCANYRTLELQAASAHKLCEYFPQFVSVIEKRCDSWEGMAVRLDNRISWKGAYEYSQKKRD